MVAKILVLKCLFCSFVTIRKDGSIAKFGCLRRPDNMDFCEELEYWAVTSSNQLEPGRTDVKLKLHGQNHWVSIIFYSFSLAFGFWFFLMFLFSELYEGMSCCRVVVCW